MDRPKRLRELTAEQRRVLEIVTVDHAGQPVRESRREDNVPFYCHIANEMATRRERDFPGHQEPRMMAATDFDAGAFDLAALSPEPPPRETLVKPCECEYDDEAFEIWAVVVTDPAAIKHELVELSRLKHAEKVAADLRASSPGRIVTLQRVEWGWDEIGPVDLLDQKLRAEAAPCSTS